METKLPIGIQYRHPRYENHSMGEARTIKFCKGQIESPHYNANGENQGIVINWQLKYLPNKSMQLF